MSFFDHYIHTISEKFPRTSADGPGLRRLLSEKLITDHVIELPVSVLTQAQAIVDAFFTLRNSTDYQIRVQSFDSQITEFDPGNFSALMSFDFHLTEDKQLKLIEINTNASMALMTALLYEAQNLENPCQTSFQHDIVETFREEHRLSKAPGDPARVAIIDEHPPEQKMYVEFLLYKELFEQHGFQCLIADPSELEFNKNQDVLSCTGERIDIVYNRHTDFYLQTPLTQPLRNAYLNGSTCLSPNPHEYHLLADKQRLNEISDADWLAEVAVSEDAKRVLRQTVPLTREFGVEPDLESIWQNRKGLFFKPKRSYGGKATYRGSSISRTMFERIIKEDYIAQEFIPAPTLTIQTGNGQTAEFKYDLRFFVYRNRIQIAAARVYQGQVTNFQTLGGGMAALAFVE